MRPLPIGLGIQQNWCPTIDVYDSYMIVYAYSIIDPSYSQCLECFLDSAVATKELCHVSRWGLHFASPSLKTPRQIRSMRSTPPEIWWMNCTWTWILAWWERTRVDGIAPTRHGIAVCCNFGVEKKPRMQQGSMSLQYLASHQYDFWWHQIFTIRTILKLFVHPKKGMPKKSW